MNVSSTLQVLAAATVALFGGCFAVGCRIDLRNNGSVGFRQSTSWEFFHTTSGSNPDGASAASSSQPLEDYLKGPRESPGTSSKPSSEMSTGDNAVQGSSGISKGSGSGTSSKAGGVDAGDGGSAKTLDADGANDLPALPGGKATYPADKPTATEAEVPPVPGRVGAVESAGP